MKYLKHLVSAIIALSISSVTLANEIKMGKADWDTGYFQAEIYKQALEKMGYKVSGPTVMKPQVFYVAATSGDVDLWVNGWFGTHDGYISESKGKVKPVGYVMKGGGAQGGDSTAPKSAASVAARRVSSATNHYEVLGFPSSTFQ